MSGRRRLGYLLIGLLVVSAGVWVAVRSAVPNDLLPVRVELASRSVSKLPFVIAMDQGLYEKYGLDIQLRMPSADFEGGIAAPNTLTRWAEFVAIRLGARSWRPEISVDGATPQIFNMVTDVGARQQIFLAATDCVVRAHIVGRKGIERLEDLKGKRLGVTSGIHTTTGFVALLLAERMGWDPVQDISIMRHGTSIDALRDGRVDALVASERTYAAALQEGFPVLAATSMWGELPIAGNSVKVAPAWLEDRTHREVARRFLQATVEGIALFHQNRELALEVLAKWHGITDQAYAETVYEGGRWIPRKPYPCYEGIEKTMERYDSNAMRRYTPEDFYEDSLIRELDESGFIDSLYTTVDSRSP